MCMISAVPPASPGGVPAPNKTSNGSEFGTAFLANCHHLRYNRLTSYFPGGKRRAESLAEAGPACLGRAGIGIMITTGAGILTHPVQPLRVVQLSDLDLILATGDLSQDGSYESYQRLAKTLSGFRAPIYWLEGNHDKPAPMLRALRGQDNRVSPCVADIGNWTLVLLDSTTRCRWAANGWTPSWWAARNASSR